MKESDSKEPNREEVMVEMHWTRSDSLTIPTFQTRESAFRKGRQPETLQVKLSVAVTFTHHQPFSIHLTDLLANTTT